MFRSEVKEITPDIALEMLAHNLRNNRMIREYDVAKYAREMRAGNWKLTHQGVAFNTQGELIDGQHRLMAVIQAGVPVKMLVTYDCDDNVVSLIDSGVARTLKDQIGLVSDDPLYKAPWIISFVRTVALTQMNYPDKYKFTSSEIIQLSERWYNICTCVYNTFRDSLHKHMRTAPYIVGLIAALANDVDPVAVKAFDAVVSYGSIITDSEMYNYQAANRYRHWFDSPARPYHGSVICQKETIRKTADAIYCFVNKQSKTLKDNYLLSAEKLDDLNLRIAEKL